MLEALAASLGLITANVGDSPTFKVEGRDKSSFIYVTFHSPRPEVVDWRVLGDFSDSDHCYITYDVQLGGRSSPTLPGPPLGWSVKRADYRAIVAHIHSTSNVADGFSDADSKNAAAQLEAYLSKICEAGMPAEL